MRRALLSLVACMVAFQLSAGAAIFYGPIAASRQTLLPTADSATSNWSASGGGTHFSMIDDGVEARLIASGDDDATYLECASATACQDTFDLTDGSGLSGKRILYVAGSAINKRQSGTQGSLLTTYLRVNSTNYSLTTASTANSTYTLFTAGTRHYTNPNTGLAWTSSDIDALQLVVDRPVTGTKVTRVTAVALVVVYEDDTLTSTRERSGGGD